MKKLQKILTLCLALVVLIGIMVVPTSAAEPEREYLVWTEDEVRDLSIPRPDANGRYVELYVIPRDKDSDELYDLIFEDGDSHMKYVGAAMCIIVDNGNSGSFSAEALKAAREAYDRNTDATWKKVIAETFGLDTNSSGSGATTKPEPEPEQPTITKLPVTPTQITPVKVDSFSDVKEGDWYYEAVMALANSGILVGYADGTFRPNNTITMGELATIMCRVYDRGTNVLEIIPGAISMIRRDNHNGHDDSTVNAGHWAEGAMVMMSEYQTIGSWAICMADMKLNRGKAMGIIASEISSATWPDGTKLSGPDFYAKRDEIIAAIPDVADDSILMYKSMLKENEMEDASHYADYRLRTTAEFPTVTTGEEAIAHDYMCAANQHCGTAMDLTSWSAGRIAEAYYIGLVNGVDSTGRCDPWAPVTRAQIAQMLYNMGITYIGQLTRWEWPTDSSGMIFGFG